jgi:AraC-like DNA-binding protein
MLRDFEPVPVLRCTYLKHFIQVFRELGLDIHSDLCQSRLPDALPDRIIEYVPAHPALAFVIATAQKHGIEGLGSTAGLNLHPSEFSDVVRQGLSQATTLGQALDSFCHLVNQEQSHVHCRLVNTDGKEARICGTVGMDPKHEAFQYSEWILIMSMLCIIRQAASQEWSPQQVSFQSQPVISALDWKALPGTQFYVGQSDTSISFPKDMLNLVWPGRNSNDQMQTHLPLEAKAVENVWGLSNSLRMALRPYLTDGYPSIELAAEISGTSVRTLQRRLSQCHLSYSDMIKQLRFDVSKDLLRDPEKKVLDAALELGFTDPSHFSRAFKHMTGISPREFRKQAATRVS